MSTDIHATDASTPTETTRTDDERIDPDAPSPGTVGESTADAPSWTDRCQRSFGSAAYARLPNLIDERNQSMPNPE